MLTGEIRNQVDQIWNAFWSGGVSNPRSVIEQITYLLFIKRLDDLHTLEESKAETLSIPMERRVFPEGADERGRAYADMRWPRFKNFEPRDVADHVFPFLRTLGEHGSSYGTHMKDARLGFSNAALLARPWRCSTRFRWRIATPRATSMNMLGRSPPPGRTASSDAATPIQLMVELTEPTPDDVI